MAEIRAEARAELIAAEIATAADIEELQVRLRYMDERAALRRSEFDELHRNATEKTEELNSRSELHDARFEELQHILLTERQSEVASEEIIRVIEMKAAETTQELNAARHAEESLEADAARTAEETSLTLQKLESHRAAVASAVEAAMVARGSAAAAEAHMTQLEQELTSQRQLEASVSEALRQEQDAAWELQEKLNVVDGRCAAAEIRANDCAKSLERSRLLERQAKERTQELRIQLELLREFGKEDFMQPAHDVDASGAGYNSVQDATMPTGGASPLGRRKSKELDDELGAALPSVLISAEVDLGLGRKATLTVAPWQTRADFDKIAQTFLDENRIKPLFRDALVHYLVDVDTAAEAFPAMVQASLSDIYARFG